MKNKTGLRLISNLGNKNWEDRPLNGYYELFKVLPGSLGVYEVSNKGKIKKFTRMKDGFLKEELLETKEYHEGIKVVSITREGITQNVKVSDLIEETFKTK